MLFDWSKITTVITIFEQLWPKIIAAIGILQGARPNATQAEIVQAVSDHMTPDKPGAPELS